MFEKVSLSNKKKYEAEISRNIKMIYNTENNIKELLRVNRDKSKTVYMNNMKVSEMYDLYNATTSSTINSNLRKPLRNDLINQNEKPLKKRLNDNEVLSPNKEAIDYKKSDVRLKTKNTIKPMSQHEQKRRNIKTEKIINLEFKNKDPSINPDYDDTYFTQFSPRKDVNKINDKDKALEETLLKAKEFITNIQNSSKNDEERAFVYEEKHDLNEKITIQTVDEAPIQEMMEKYDNLKKFQEKKNSSIIMTNICLNNDKEITENHKEKSKNQTSEENKEDQTNDKIVNKYKESFNGKSIQSSNIEEKKAFDETKSVVKSTVTAQSDSNIGLKTLKNMRKAPSIEKIVIGLSNNPIETAKQKNIDNKSKSIITKNSKVDEKKIYSKPNELQGNLESMKMNKKLINDFDDMIL